MTHSRWEKVKFHKFNNLITMIFQASHNFKHLFRIENRVDGPGPLGLMIDKVFLEVSLPSLLAAEDRLGIYG